MVAGEARAADLGAPVLLMGEDEAEYNRLLAQVAAAVGPTDVIEEFWVRDVVDLVWEALRLRRLKASLVLASARLGLERVLQPTLNRFEAGNLAGAWYARDETARQRVDEFLEQIGLTIDAVMAQTLSAKLDDIERIDRMLANAEARRHLVLREIDRHRAAVAARLRTATEAIEDAEYSEPGQAGLDKGNAPAAAA